jgi:hypothetical protein
MTSLRIRFASLRLTTPFTGQPRWDSSASTLLIVPLPKAPSTAVAMPSRVRARCR